MLPQRLSNYTVASVALSIFFHALLAFFIHQRGNKLVIDAPRIVHAKDKLAPKVLPYRKKLLQRPKPLQAQLDAISSQRDLKKLLQAPVKIEAHIDRLVKPEQVDSTPAKLSKAPGEKSPLLQTLPPLIYQITDLQTLPKKNTSPPIDRILNPDALLPIASKQGGSGDTSLGFSKAGQAGQISLP